MPVNSLVDASRSDPGVGINALKSDSVTNSNNYSKPLINEWVAASYDYIVTKIASEYLGVDTNDLGTDNTTYTYSYKYSFKFLLNVQLVLDDIVKKKLLKLQVSFLPTLKRKFSTVKMLTLQVRQVPRLQILFSTTQSAISLTQVQISVKRLTLCLSHFLRQT